MSKRKDYIPLREKLAAALSTMLVEGADGTLERAIPEADARKMTADQVISLFHFDHGVYETWGGATAHHNLTPRFIRQHREKTAMIDRPRIAKASRVEKARAAHKCVMQAKTAGQIVEKKDTVSTRSRFRSRPLRPPGAPKQKIPSRPFPKRDKRR